MQGISDEARQAVTDMAAMMSNLGLDHMLSMPDPMYEGYERTDNE